MLIELHVRDLGVISDLNLLLGAGMTALTGETGAGKTLVVDAIELLLGGRGDPVLVRPGSGEAFVEGRFAVEDTVDGEPEDLIVARGLPASGRSRPYVNGSMATLAGLAETTSQLVDLHGQHVHQSLLRPQVQRAAVDAFGAIDHGPVLAARAHLNSIDQALASVGGDERARALELDLLQFQVTELDAAELTDPDEDARLNEEEDRLADATAHREAASRAAEAVSSDSGVADALGAAIAALAGRAPLAIHEQRLRDVAAELTDVAAELRAAAETLEDDPERLSTVRTRRALLHDLRRKYGDTLAEVLDFASRARRRLEELSHSEQEAARLVAERVGAEAAVVKAETALGRARRKAAPRLAAAIETQLHRLAMPRARFEVVVGEGRAGDEVLWLLGANPGGPSLPLAKVASGGELARTMLAARLVLGGASAGVQTLVFDEVDAGVGGEAAVAVGRALAQLAMHHQVLVVTHLPQVAAFAGHQIAVRKQERDGRTVATVHALDQEERVVELARMLSGRPDSATARRHAEELLAAAGGGSEGGGGTGAGGGCTEPG